MADEAAPAPAEASESAEGTSMDMTPEEENAAAEASASAENAEAGTEKKEENASTMDVEKPRPKKKVKRTDLTVDTQLMGGLTPEMFQKSYEREVAMVNEDKVIAETAAKRNDLEGFVYEMRDKVMAELAEYVAEEPKNQLIEKLDQVCFVLILASVIYIR